MKLVNHHHTTTSASHLLRRRQVFAALPRLSPQPIRRLAAAGSSPPNVIDGQWLGSDAFSQLNDRLDAAPLPLPSISRPLRVCLVRHGQSTWNAEGRIQGSSDLSVLSAKGVIQAEAARDMLAELPFTSMFHSPLARATQTATTICEGRQLPSTQLPALREVDLYGFQGLIKAEGKARYGAQYLQWQRRPAEFEIDGHAPVRELWYRASLAWQQVLAQAAVMNHTPHPQQQQQRSNDCTPDLRLLKDTDKADDLFLVVAHNAVNQALICTALGLGPSSFRAITQANAAVTMLQLTPPPDTNTSAGRRSLTQTVVEEQDGRVPLGDTAPEGSGLPILRPPRVQLLCLNQTSAEVLKVEDGVIARIILMCCDGATQSASGLAAVTRLAKLMSSTQVHAVAGLAIHHQAAQQLQQLLPSPAPFTQLQLSSASKSTLISEGSSRGTNNGGTASHTWAEVCGMASHLGGQNLIVLLDAASSSHLICEALTLSSKPNSQQTTPDNAKRADRLHITASLAADVGHQEGSQALHPFCMLPGTIAIINFSGDPVSTPAVLHSILTPGLEFSRI